jgi:hypothetical protein
MSCSQDGELLPKSQVFQQQVAAGSKKLGKNGRQNPKHAQHKASFTRKEIKGENNRSA